MRTRNPTEKLDPLHWLRPSALIRLVQGSTGSWGEKVASRYLEKNGLIIIKRNWSSTRLEADIIGLEHRTLVVVEVKTRHSSLQQNYRGIDAINAQKLDRLCKLGSRFMSNNGPLCRRLGIKTVRIDGLEVYYRTGPLGCRIKTTIWRHRGLADQ
jgi:putative endonuclease